MKQIGQVQIPQKGVYFRPCCGQKIADESIPHVTLIDFDFMLLADQVEFLLNGHRPMVFGLCGSI